VPNLVALSLAGASHHPTYVKYYAVVPFCLLSCPVFFSGERPGRTPGWIFTVDGSNDAFSPNDVPFGGQNNES